MKRCREFKIQLTLLLTPGLQRNLPTCTKPFRIFRGGERGPVTFPAFKAGDSALRGSNGGFDFHTPPPTLCYQADLSEIDSNSGSDSNCAPIWLERRSDAARSSLPTTWA